jgi:hypothetical protein
MRSGEQILTDKNNRAFMSTDPYRNRSGLSHFLLLQGFEYCDNVGADLFLFRSSDTATDHLVRCAFLTVTDELLQLLGLRQPAELDRAVDFERPVSQGFY